MKRYFIPIAVMLVAVSMLFTSCSLFHDGHFDGGKILDADLLDSIRDEIFDDETAGSDGESTGTDVHEDSSLEGSAGNTESEENNFESDSEIISDTEKSVETDTAVVYWTKGGEVWHLYRDCGYLKKAKEISSGTLDEALSAGKTKVCSGCNKKQNN